MSPTESATWLTPTSRTRSAIAAAPDGPAQPQLLGVGVGEVALDDGVIDHARRVSRRIRIPQRFRLSSNDPPAIRSRDARVGPLRHLAADGDDGEPARAARPRRAGAAPPLDPRGARAHRRPRPGAAAGAASGGPLHPRLRQPAPER